MTPFCGQLDAPVEELPPSAFPGAEQVLRLQKGALGDRQMKTWLSAAWCSKNHTWHDVVDGLRLLLDCGELLGKVLDSVGK